MEVAGSRSGWERRRQALLGEYEQAALRLFAERGYRDVTVEEIAEVLGVSGRTLFRYFPTKEDILLGLPRRHLTAKIEMIRSLDPGPSPLETAWGCLLDSADERARSRSQMALWRRAARDVPDVVARVRGERIERLIVALTAYFAGALGVDPRLDIRPRLLAGLLAGGELAVMESLTRSRLPGPQLIASARTAVINAASPLLGPSE